MMKKFFYLLFPLLLVFFPAGTCWAEEKSAGVDPTWTEDDIVLAENASGWEISPDGTLAVSIRSEVKRVKGEEKRVTNLWLTWLEEERSIPLTRGTDRVSSPAFSPDGQLVAFRSNRSIPGAEPDEVGKNQIWVIPVGGGEAYPSTRFDRSVEAFGWIDAKSLVVLAPESLSSWERERKKKKDTAVVVDDAEHEPPVRLFRVAIGKKSVDRLTRNQDWIDSLSVSPDGKHAVVTAQQSLSYEFDQKQPPYTFLVDLNSGVMTRLFEAGALLPFSIRWAPDSNGFYLVNEFTRHPVYRMATIFELHFYALEKHLASRVDLAWDRGLGRGDYLPVPGGVLVLLADGVRNRPAQYMHDRGGDRQSKMGGTHIANIDDWAVSRDGRRVIYRTSSATRPPQWFVARRTGNRLEGERPLTKLNPGYRGKPTGRVEVIHWEGARGDDVEGILQYPLGWQEGRRYPLILDIHGGPASADRDSWDQRWVAPSLLWRQRGAFVFQVNYHGSSGYGIDWVESIGGGNYYELEIPDIESGVDLLIARGLVDPDRLATSGWSNGGILSAELITRTHRYRAASIGAADVEWISDWANVDFGAAFDNYYFGASPLESPQTYLEKSPFFRLPGVTTPTIIYTGTEDRNVPPHQSWSLFRALQQTGKTAARLVLFPGEPHGLRKIAHQRRKIQEDLAWFDRYLFERADEKSESIQKGSLLAGLLGRSKAARTGTAYGISTREGMVPETVSFQGLQVGRFEVTRTQFALFDPDTTVIPGEKNLPMTGVSFEQARDYAAWLSGFMGEPYRLPTTREARRLAKKAGDSGNTLDRWAGYPPNPEDVAGIEKVLANLGRDVPLLLPVGSLPGAGENPVFDLDGNAGEWAVDDQGKGQAVGPSADRPIDPRHQHSSPGPAYTGFRVILGSPDHSHLTE